MRHGSLRCAFASLALSAALATVARAQQPDTTNADTPPPIPTELPSLEGRPSPRGAMLRSFILPGWGQASYDRYFRGGVYFMGNAGNLYMIFKTLQRLGEARDIEERRVAPVRERLVEEGVPVDSLDIRIDQDPTVRSIRGLESAREEQREDWIALGLFWILISGIDAYVTAQLADFPASIGAASDGRRVEVFVTIPVR